ncbi:phosphomannomutase PmmB [Cutibacterium acnes JCM 18920]|nr:phosphomannomutase PmmB [Cutibacterium acnes JCM 18920]
MVRATTAERDRADRTSRSRRHSSLRHRAEAQVLPRGTRSPSGIGRRSVSHQARLDADMTTLRDEMSQALGI